MGTRGPRGEIPAIKKAKGNPGKRPVQDSGIVATGDPFAPDHISDAAKACLEIILQSQPSGTHVRLDSFLLSVFATEWAMHKLATINAF